MLNIASIDRNSFIYGPGKRMVIWVQGCNLKCPGCWNTALHSFDTKTLMTSNQIVTLFEEDVSLEGVTILGGEPLLQKQGMFEFIQEFKKRHKDKSIIMYTGFEDEEISEVDWNFIKSYIDIIISGRYKRELRDTSLFMRGSSNQKLNFLSDFYSPSIIDDGNYVEIELDENGQTTTRGYPNSEIIKLTK